MLTKNNIVILHHLTRRSVLSHLEKGSQAGIFLYLDKIYGEKRLQKKKINERIREHDKRAEAMQKMILPIMKKNSIGALDLKSSNARALFKKRVIKSPLGIKEMKKYFNEHFKEGNEAVKLLEFLDTKRETIVRESLVYEKNDA